MMKRRDFLKSGLATLAVGGIAPTQLFAEEQGAFSQARFAALKGGSMRVGAAGSWTSLRLSEVRPLGGDPRFEQFELVLEGAAGLGEGLHAVIPEEGSPLRFHLSPAGDGRYVALFNRRKTHL